jgi:hypothetical protein
MPGNIQRKVKIQSKVSPLSQCRCSFLDNGKDYILQHWFHCETCKLELQYGKFFSLLHSKIIGHVLRYVRLLCIQLSQKSLYTV